MRLARRGGSAQWAAAIDDLRLRQLHLQFLLHRGNIAENRDRDVLQDTTDYARPEGEVLLLRGRIDHLTRDRPTLRLVAVDQEGGVPDSIERVSQLPSQIGSVLNPSIHPLSAGGTMDVRGVADEKTPRRAIAGRQALVDMEGREPGWIAKAETARAMQIHQAL